MAPTSSSETVVYLGSTGGKAALVGSGILIELDLPGPQPCSGDFLLWGGALQGEFTPSL